MYHYSILRQFKLTLTAGTNIDLSNHILKNRGVTLNMAIFISLQNIIITLSSKFLEIDLKIHN